MSMELLDPAHATREVAEMMRAFGQVSRDEMPKRAHTSSLAGDADDEFESCARSREGGGE